MKTVALIRFAMLALAGSIFAAGASAASTPDDFSESIPVLDGDAEALLECAISSSELEACSELVEIVASQLGPAASLLPPPEHPPRPVSCTQQCTGEIRQCVRVCDGDEDSGFTCYLDCRISYYVCLGGCL
jgi:hypothetical protein